MNAESSQREEVHTRTAEESLKDEQLVKMEGEIKKIEMEPVPIKRDSLDLEQKNDNEPEQQIDAMEGESKEIEMELASIKRDSLDLEQINHNEPDEQLDEMEGDVKEIEMKLALIKQNSLDMEQINHNAPQKQLGEMEGEVKEIQMELAAIKRDRLDLQQRTYNEPDTEVVKDSATCGESEFPNDHGELSEITKLREDLMKAKYVAEDERIKREKYEAKLKDLEEQLYNICRSDTSSLSKVYRKLNENETNSMKTQIRDLKDELDELRLALAEKTEQVQEYRVKYLQAQQQVAEQKRQLEDLEYDNKQVSEQVQMEIQKMKIQFQEKLQELAPLPDLLKGAQYELQEAKQMQLLAEDSTQQLSNELKRVNEKLIASVTKLYYQKSAKKKLLQDNKDLKKTIEEKESEINELCKVLDEYKSNVVSLQEKLGHEESRYNEKAIECVQLSEQLDEMKNEATRSLNRCKDRSKSMRRTLQSQIAEMERQLVQSRALCYATQKERDEVRQRMLVQLSGLQENYEVVENRLKTFQSQLLSIKKNFASLFGDDIENELSKLTFK